MRFALALLAALVATAAPAQERCLEHPYFGSDRLPALQDDLRRVFDALAPFPELVEAIEARKPRICLDDGPSEALGTFETLDGTITVASALAQDERIAVLLHEVRHLEQFARGVCPTTTLAMRPNARAVFALEADAMAIMHLVAWSYAERGSPGPLAALRDSEQTGNIGAAFAAEMAASGEVRLATAAAFAAWYASEVRRERYYVSTCMAYLDRLDAEHSFAGTEGLPEDFTARLCSFPGSAGSYPCQEPGQPLPR